MADTKKEIEDTKRLLGILVRMKPKLHKVYNPPASGAKRGNVKRASLIDSNQSQQWLGWRPIRPGLISDLDDPGYFQT
jgi:hypothetical protein